jgi:hypothetical protein
MEIVAVALWASIDLITPEIARCLHPVKVRRQVVRSKANRSNFNDSPLAGVNLNMILLLKDYVVVLLQPYRE